MDLLPEHDSRGDRRDRHDHARVGHEDTSAVTEVDALLIAEDALLSVETPLMGWDPQSEDSLPEEPPSVPVAARLRSTWHPSDGEWNCLGHIAQAGLWEIRAVLIRVAKSWS